MANIIKISEMDPATEIAGDELIPIVKSGINETTTPSAIAALVDAGARIVTELPEADTIDVGSLFLYKGNIWVVVEDEESGSGMENMFVQASGLGVPVFDELPDPSTLEPGTVFIVFAAPNGVGEASGGDMFLVYEYDNKGSLENSSFMLNQNSAKAPMPVTNWSAQEGPNPLVISEDHAFGYVRNVSNHTGTLEIPLDATEDLPVGTWVRIGAVPGYIEVSPDFGVTLNLDSTKSTVSSRHSAVLVKVAADEWDLLGDGLTSPSPPIE